MIDLKKGQLEEFLKLYSYKVPYKKEYKYYLGLQQQLDNSLLDKLKEFEKSWELYLDSGKASYKDYKLSLVEQCILHQKSNLNKINLLSQENVKLNEIDYKFEDGYFISIDLIEANHNSFFKLSGFGDNPAPFRNYYYHFLNGDPAFLNSKKIRQYIYGNLNPKKQAQHQKETISKIIEVVNGFNNKNLKIVKVSTDELVLKVTATDLKTIKNIHAKLESFLIKNDNFFVPFRVELFKISVFLFNGEKVVVKHNLHNNKKSFIAIPGNRYFVYYQLLNPKHVPSELDYYFECDKKIAKWLE